MIKIHHTDEFLISELQRFYDENGRVPTQLDMQRKFGYPSVQAYKNHFGTFNNALETAGLKVNNYYTILDGTETCSYCGKRADEIEGFTQWRYPNNIRYCVSCYQKSKSDYMNGKLDKSSNTAKGTISEQIVKNVLNLEDRHDCNFACGFNYKVDLYDKDRYFNINVKDSKLHNSDVQSSRWFFDLTQKVIPDTYIMLGYDENRKNILKVWITDAIDDLVFNEKTGKLIQSKTISDTYESLKKAKPWEVDVKPYDDMLHKMSKKRKKTDGKNCFLNNSDLNS